ncbi:acyl-CoA dehydrogenase [Streptomyces sp. CBMA152]|uniref:acyl-CoA dehydrogenase n=1 Tax=Streptomyces sp. CBMA152 TaxID=1896312 RepID=UPI001CB750FA|nr:acyl-CoA dehydrogenase family protein [Streptomyces sp. CBMA152]
MSEKSSGSDLASVATRAQRTADGWRLTGTKMWTGGAHVNDYAIVLARTDDAEDKHAGLSQFIVDLRAPGVRIEPIHLMSGEHRFNAFHLEGVDVPDSMLLGQQGEGWKQVTGELAFERSGPERYLSAFPLLVSLLRELEQRPGTAEQLTRVGILMARLHSIRRLSLGVAAALDAGASPDIQAALVKDLGTRFEGTLTDTVRSILPTPADPHATPGTHAELLDEARLRYLARSALIAGAAERCLDLMVAHTTARTQFGRPLSRFQAVKQEEARLIEEAALVRAAVQAAAAPLDTGGAASHFAVAAAKTQASASAAEITRIAHQLHGAIGITRLHPLHLATTRLWSWRDEDGDETHWARRLARPLTATALWPTLTTTP